MQNARQAFKRAWCVIAFGFVSLRGPLVVMALKTSLTSPQGVETFIKDVHHARVRSANETLLQKVKIEAQTWFYIPAGFHPILVNVSEENTLIYMQPLVSKELMMKALHESEHECAELRKVIIKDGRQALKDGLAYKSLKAVLDDLE